MDVPRDLPFHLSSAFRAVGLPWPDVRIAHFDSAPAELGEHREAPRPREHIGRLRTILEAFFGHLDELAADHDGDPKSVSRHTDDPCVTGVRDDWAETAALMPDLHTAITTFVQQLLGGPRGVPDYLAAAPAWVKARARRGVRDEPTTGHAPAADALLRRREDPYGPRICVVTRPPPA
ncbi:hypothetical protein [Nonomuraea maritima]|uniref:hypothetical protein n=1 Tax=Nonomuraea maritima TaxID=683260 RepID=UPI003722E524